MPHSWSPVLAHARYTQGLKGRKGQGKGDQGEWAYLEKEKALLPATATGAHMLSLFHRKHAVPAATPAMTPPEKKKGLLQPQPATALLDTPRRRKLLEHIWERTSLSRRQFGALYRIPLERYAALVQQFPASESHHHSYPGGMLDHGLETVAYALKLRQSHMLPAGATPEDQAAQAEAWTAATAYAALLHDVGKVAVDLHVEYADGVVWHPWHGPLRHPYRFRYRSDREYRLHGAAAGLLYNQLLDRPIFDWLSLYPVAWSALLYTLAGQMEHAGVLGELVTKADQASVAQDLGGNPAKALTAPKHALQRKLLEGLRYLLKEEFKLNQPQGSDGWLTQEVLWLVSKTASDKLRAHLLAQGIEGVPANNTAIFNVLQDHGMLVPTPDGKAIWKAAVTSDTGWSHTFTLLRLTPVLIWENGERPAPFAGTVEVVQDTEAAADETTTPPDNAQTSIAGTGPQQPPDPSTSARAAPAATTDATDGVAALLQLLGTPDVEPSRETVPPASTAATLAAPEPQQDDTPGGEHFVAWLKRSIQGRTLIINDAKALVHTTADTAYLVSPGVFQRYAQEHPQVAFLAKQDKLQDWQWVQKRFEKLGLHRKQDNGLNIWTVEVSGPRKSRRLHGYLLEDPQHLFDEVPPNNPYLSISPAS